MKSLLQRVGLWLARLGGWEQKALLQVEQVTVDKYKLLIADAAQYFHNAKNIVSSLQAKLKDAVSGEYKRAEAYRVLLNQFPQAAKKDLGLAIELAVKACSTQPPSGR